MKIDAPQLCNFQPTWNILFCMFRLSSLLLASHQLFQTFTTFLKPTSTHFRPFSESRCLHQRRKWKLSDWNSLNLLPVAETTIWPPNTHFLYSVTEPSLMELGHLECRLHLQTLMRLGVAMDLTSGQWKCYIELLGRHLKGRGPETLPYPLLTIPSFYQVRTGNRWIEISSQLLM